ncbi:ABC transporter ATP-binding protein [Devosia rhizoryzae]|uniref:ABC transporter ATP-binding protein n=1 Tax=Devosia rhizoryzae TaxID=2774137 RepID=A0ABX7CAN5_9HYPH|nr:ABC transporter ATP-binding protein [Devosia rhizoryzae]QQR41281.1 ABC transporter ATP-binding protein [Devosia rhizoryzae]
MTMLQLVGVSKSYGDQQAVSDIGIVAPAGRRTVIVGPSGSGKTTLLRLIAGFERPDSGSITLDGQPLATVPPHQRNIAYVAQEGALFPHMSVAGNIGFAMPRRATERLVRIDELLARVGLPTSMKSRRPHELSGGQQQRVALARALAQQPALMLLDEPFSALDAGLRENLRDMVETVLREAGIASILVTHDQSEALAFADHLVVMQAGRVADAGPPQRLYDRPNTAATARFLGSAIVLDGDIRDGFAHTVLGAIRVAATEPRHASILLRPEQLTVSPAEAGTSEGPQATVLSRLYQGSSWRLKIACPGLDQPIDIFTTAHHINPADMVQLHVSGYGHIIPED